MGGVGDTVAAAVIAGVVEREEECGADADVVVAAVVEADAPVIGDVVVAAAVIDGPVERGEECGAAADVVVVAVDEADKIEAAVVVAAAVVAGEGCEPDTTDEVGET
jgi:hypothetical protein